MTGKEAGRMIGEARTNDKCAQFSLSSIRLIADMVKEGIYPNGNFSDDECNLWSVFAEVARKDPDPKLL